MKKYVYKKIAKFVLAIELLLCALVAFRSITADDSNIGAALGAAGVAVVFWVIYEITTVIFDVAENTSKTNALLEEISKKLN